MDNKEVELESKLFKCSGTNSFVGQKQSKVIVIGFLAIIFENKLLKVYESCAL